MKAMKTTLIATAAIGLVAAIGVQFGGVPAFAQAAAPTAAPAPTTSSIPVHAGNFSGGKIDSLVYTPSCPVFNFDMDAAAIQDSTSRTYVEGEKRRFEAVREKWDSYEDCLLKNAERDIETIRVSLGDYSLSTSNAEVAKYTAMAKKGSENVERVGKLPAPKASKKKGAPEPVEVAPVVDTWVDPTGRLVGTWTLSGDKYVYQSGCPDAFGSFTGEAFDTVQSREGFNALSSQLNGLVKKIGAVQNCRKENLELDYEDLQKVVQAGVDAVFVPSKTAFEKEYSAVRFQLNQHQMPGGLLAPPEMGRAPAKKAPPAKAPAGKAKKK